MDNPNTEVNSAGNEAAKPKRKYNKRKGEFDSLDVAKMLEIRDQVSLDIKGVNDALKLQPNDQDLTEKKNELVNKRVRVYARLRELGHSAQTLRAKNKPAASTEPTPATDPAPVSQNPQ